MSKNRIMTGTAWHILRAPFTRRAYAEQLVVSDRAVEKHISNIFSKLGLPPSDSGHRRVLAVLAYLDS
jgi:DNA-binding NarL/FixJ family response regulator